jgi:hypothetical protein
VTNFLVCSGGGGTNPPAFLIALIHLHKIFNVQSILFESGRLYHSGFRDFREHIGRILYGLHLPGEPSRQFTHQEGNLTSVTASIVTG